MNAQVRTFDSGATRNLDAGKLDFEGFLSPLVLERYAQYMHKHREQADGTLRDSDNWQKGIPLPVYMKSGWRHFFDWWKEHRGLDTEAGIEDTLCALLFNISGYLHEYLKAQAPAVEQRLTAFAAAVYADPIAAIHAHVPPYAERDSDEPMGLTAGEAITAGGTD
ncbi:hypothetical protein [Lysobacter panacisoli]|uniref:dATP/dGTP diphosphohydrolase N-terminal domain-containing protein n=1 Tax=Lysobacter panacisoli TaxID=1255263 RepID=A0ABP9LG68_9GAMM|nr:hypothetical protein [Lysobacter panacisoli]